MKYIATLFLAILLMPAQACAEDNAIELLEQRAWRTAIDAVADSVVQIRTVGGIERVGKTLLSQGPTTGLIVSTDGYIVSSAFNFAGHPTSILVRLASGQQLPAEIIARDKNRMLVLLKVESEAPLPVPKPTPRSEMQVGQWSIALGRTFRSDQVDVTVGILSALNRMYGRVIQTDASISASNYGGPLIDVYGRVLGVLVPMAPQSSGEDSTSELAGSQFYDSGIGFAVPLEHVNKILERWKQGDDLLPGKLGIGLQKGGAQVAPPKISAVWPESPAAKAGWKPDDLILAVDGQPVQNQAQLRFQIATRYAGETLIIKTRRGDNEAAEEQEAELTLAGELPPYQHAFLGILPSRTQKAKESPGILVEGVWPGSPANTAGLQSGDRLLSIASKNLSKTDDALKAINALHPKETVELTVKRDEEELVLSAKVSTLPENILSRSEIPPRSTGEAGEPDNGELQPLKLPDFSQETQFYLPPPKPNQSPGLLLWLVDHNTAEDQELAGDWQEICRRDHLVLLLAHPAEETGWTASDLPYLWRLTKAAKSRWSIDPRRLVIGGQKKAGQLAYALAFQRRNSFSGAFGIDAPLPRTLKIPENRPGLRLATLTVESRNSTFAPLLRRDLQSLTQAGYSASWLQRPMAAGAKEPLDPATRNALARWIDGLDRF